MPLLFGIDVEGVGPLVEDVQLLLEGHVSWGPESALAARGVPSGDFHEWFEINNVPPEVTVKVLALPSAKVTAEDARIEAFLRRSRRQGRQRKLPYDAEQLRGAFHLLPRTRNVRSHGRKPAASPRRRPSASKDATKSPSHRRPTVTPETSQSQYDSPDGATTDVHVPQLEKSNQINTADIADAHVTLPEGLTLNPSAAHGLEACTQAQLGKGTRNPVSCPAGSKIGTVNIETDLPPGSLAGNVYLGQANGTSAINGPPYLVFIDAESVYDVSVRLEGQAVPNPTTGRLEVSFLGNPQLPFSDLTLTLNGGPRSPLANPLSCGAASTSFVFSAYTGASFGGSTPFATTRLPEPRAVCAEPEHRRARTQRPAPTAHTRSTSRAPTASSISPRCAPHCPRACSARSPR